MGFQPGSLIGPYQVLGLIGKGGMGEVFRARDMRLNREVALKSLPEEFARHPHRLARLKREAQILASLNHSNIAHVYGLEVQPDTSTGGAGVPTLVMELVEGPTLAEHIARAPIDPRNALVIARQLAEALAAAHDAGVVHRDLKPSNVKVREDGAVKVLDFGLAKLETEAHVDASSEVVMASTVTAEPLLTAAGAVLGTAAYMSPEQAQGRAADRRSDVWAFGCLLYEMLTRRRPFSGGSAPETLANVLTAQPDWNALPADTPRAIRRLLRRCLEKDRKRRLADMTTAGLEIDEALAGHDSGDLLAGSTARRTAATPLRRIGWAVGALGVLAAAAGGVVLVSRYLTDRPPPAPMRASILVPRATPLTPNLFPVLAISPDGQSVAYSGGASGNQQRRLYLRRIDTFTPIEIRDSEGAASSFFSPDSRSVAFFARGELKIAPLSGGVANSIVPLQAPYPGEWTSDGTILFTPKANEGLWRVPASGGTASAVTSVDRSRGELAHAWPQVLPGGQILFSVRFANRTDQELRLLDGGAIRTLVPQAGPGRYVDGNLVFIMRGAIVARAFDPVTLALGGDTIVLADDVLKSGPAEDVAQFSIGADSSIAYVPRPAAGARRELFKVRPDGQAQLLIADQRVAGPRLSPDGTRFLFVDRGDIWTYAIASGVWNRLTFDGANDAPIWGPRGTDVWYRMARAGRPGIVRQPADGRGAAERITEADGSQWPAAVTADGRTLVFSQSTTPGGGDIWTYSLTGPRTPSPFLVTPAATWAGGLSPDGSWIVYSSNETGRAEVYVTSFPGGEGKWLISTEGGTEPVWSRDGKGIFYRAGDRMMFTPLSPGTALNPGRPRLLFERRYLHCCDGLAFYDVSDDGSAMMVEEEDAHEIRIIRNWNSERSGARDNRDR